MDQPLDPSDDAAPTGIQDLGIRDVLDSLIHGPDVRSRRSEGDAGPDTRSADIARRGVGSERIALPADIADEATGLYDRPAWAAVVAAEDARWLRFQRPCEVIQLEIAGISAIADRLGAGVADSLIAILARTLREDTRGSDMYARADPWRVQGLLPEQEPDGGPIIEGRIREGFRRRLGPELPIGLLIGMAAPRDTGGIRQALVAAGGTMLPDAQVAAGHGPGPGPRTQAAPGSDVRSILMELEQLRGDGLISKDEYQRKRGEVLDRL